MVAVCAGRGGENEMAFGEVVNFIPVRRDMVGNSDEKSYFAVEVSGRSMEPKITGGLLPKKHKKARRLTGLPCRIFHSFFPSFS